MKSKHSSVVSPDRPYLWVDEPGQLKKVIRELSGETLIGLDTESDSFHHYREKVCLIQISTKDVDYIIDPLALEDLSAMLPLFTDKKKEWVMNGADYDVVCLKRDFGIHFAKLFDTVVAAQLLGYKATGLAAMLELHFDVKVSKTYQRDEWFRRPLTEHQIAYALNDTRYLISLRRILKKKLEEKKRLSWAEEEFAILSKREWTREPFSPDDFWRIRGARELSKREQLILRDLNVMRDKRARAMNRPPFKIVSDAVLLAIARHRPRSLTAVKRIKGLSPLMVRRLGEDILAAVRTGLEAEEGTLPTLPRSPRRRHDPGVGGRLDVLKAWRRQKAEKLEMDPGVLSPLSTLQAVARANPTTVDQVLEIPELSRWRAREFGREWVEALARRR